MVVLAVVSLFLVALTYQLATFMMVLFPSYVLRDRLLTNSNSSKIDFLMSRMDEAYEDACHIPAECGTCVNVTRKGGVIQSPNFPLEYSPDLNCILTIQSPNPRKKVLLNFTQFVVEDCCDFLSVFDGLTRPLGVGLRGYSIPQVNITTSDRMTIKFTTNSDNSLLDPTVFPPKWQATFRFAYR